jgi:hypothetical protein
MVNVSRSIGRGDLQVENVYVPDPVDDERALDQPVRAELGQDLTGLMGVDEHPAHLDGGTDPSEDAGQAELAADERPA